MIFVVEMLINMTDINPEEIFHLEENQNPELLEFVGNVKKRKKMRINNKEIEEQEGSREMWPMGTDKFILDTCCSGRMFWFDKNHENAIYVDHRELKKGSLEKTPNFEIKPDRIMDFRNLDFPDKTFKMVVFDPPHLKSLDENSWIATKYGTLNPDTWREDILQGFSECWRVLDDYGTLIFKWSKSHDNRKKRDVSTAAILKLLPVKPLFGHPSGSKMNTIWMCFMKIPGATL